MGKRTDQRPKAVGATGDGEDQAGAAAAPSAAGERDARIRFVIPIKTISEANARGHWSARAKRACAQRVAAGLCVYQATTAHRGFRCLPRQLLSRSASGRITIAMTRVGPRTLDDDNLRGALKAIRDGIATSIGIDDGSAALRWEYAQRRGATREYAVEVEIAPENA